jgi:hypothetical protein
MAQPKWIEKYLRMKPEVTKLFDDLEAYLDYCKINMLKFDEKDLYRSEQYRRFEKYRNWLYRRGNAEQSGEPQKEYSRPPRKEYSRAPRSQQQQT